MKLTCKERGLKMALPTGSMEAAVFQLFDDAGWTIKRNGNGRSLIASIDDPRFDEIILTRPQDSPGYTARGKFHIAITGQDWIIESGNKDNLVEICKLPLTKGGRGEAELVLCVHKDSPYKKVSDLPSGAKVETEYVEITEKFFADRSMVVDVILSHGATEIKPKQGLCDAVMELTETGGTLRENELVVLTKVLDTTACVVANKESAVEFECEIAEIVSILQGVIYARGNVFIEFHIKNTRLPEAMQHLPSLKKPTVIPLTEDESSVRAVVPKLTNRKDGIAGVNMIIPLLKRAGAEDIVEMPLQKLVP